MDSNLFMRDSNRLCQFKLFGMWILIAIWGIRITFFSLNFLECRFESLYEGFESFFSNLLEKLQNWKVNWGIRIALLGVQIWPLENSSKCSFVKIFLGIFIYILKHLFSLISKHNMSVLVSSKSTRVQQSYRPSSKCQNLKSTMEPNALRTIWPRIVTRWRGTLVMKICWSMCSMKIWSGSSSMVYETEERPNSYMEKSSPSIFEVIQIHVGDSPEPFDPSKHEKGTGWRL